MMERNTRQTTDCTDYSIIYLCMLFPSDRHSTRIVQKAALFVDGTCPFFSI